MTGGREQRAARECDATRRAISPSNADLRLVTANDFRVLPEAVVNKHRSRFPGFELSVVILASCGNPNLEESHV